MESYLLYIHIYILCRSLLMGCFAHSAIEYELFLNRSIWALDGALTGTTTLCQSGTEGNANDVCYILPKFLKAI